MKTNLKACFLLFFVLMYTILLLSTRLSRRTEGFTTLHSEYNFLPIKVQSAAKKTGISSYKSRHISTNNTSLKEGGSLAYHKSERGRSNHSPGSESISRIHEDRLNRSLEYRVMSSSNSPPSENCKDMLCTNYLSDSDLKSLLHCQRNSTNRFRKFVGRGNISDSVLGYLGGAGASGGEGDSIGVFASGSCRFRNREG